MAYKARSESDELKILRILNTRMDLSAEEKKYYSNLEKGYEGEVQFDLLTEKIQSECIVLNNLFLKINNILFTVNTLIIFQDAIYLLMVKNYEGEFIFKNERLESTSGNEMKDPLGQLKQNETLFLLLLKNLGYNLSVKAHVVFVNPEFTLFQAPLNQTFIFPAQLNRFLKKLNRQRSVLTNSHKMLAEKLVFLHQTKSSNTCFPAYEFSKLKKRITCKKCSTCSLCVRGRKLVCNDCGYEEEVEAAVMRSVEEIRLLFPDWKITTNIVHEWCGVIDSKKRINRILKRNFEIVGVHQWSYYK